MRVARFSVLGVFLLVAAQVSRAEEGVSLEATKQELRQLESTQKNKAGSLVPDRVKMDTPMLHLEMGGNSSAALLADRKKEDEDRARRLKQKKDENWLVNGVERLAREGTAATSTTAGDSTELNALPNNTPDPTDPQYLLKLYDEQEKRSATKGVSVKARPPTPAPDPFAPFLQDWLGTSPVRSQVMDQFRKSGETASVVPTPAGTTNFPAPVTANTPAGPLPFATNTPAKANPYLVDSRFSAPTTNNAIGGPVLLPAIERSSLNALPAPLPAAPMVSPAPEARTPAKGPPPSPVDDKKYFPQLNRF